MLKIRVKPRKRQISEPALRRLGESAMRQLLNTVHRTVRQKLSGQVLNVRTGQLRGSFRARLTWERLKIRGILGSPVAYARIHEVGGVIRTRRAVIRMPARPYLRPSFEENRQAGFAIFAKHLNRHVQRRH